MAGYDKETDGIGLLEGRRSCALDIWSKHLSAIRRLFSASPSQWCRLKTACRRKQPILARMVIS
eukprot:scaffold4629_cov138-Pinguiococcus_pyrenoidosus.AAC.1